MSIQGFGTPAVEHFHNCDGCLETIRGTRYHCLVCPDVDFCSRCIAKHISATAPTVHPHAEFTAVAGRVWSERLPGCPLSMQSLMEPLSLLSALTPGLTVFTPPTPEQGARLTMASKGVCTSLVGCVTAKFVDWPLLYFLPGLPCSFVTCSLSTSRLHRIFSA